MGVKFFWRLQREPPEKWIEGWLAIYLMFGGRGRRCGLATIESGFNGRCSFTKLNCIIAHHPGTNYNTCMGIANLSQHTTQGGQIDTVDEFGWRLSCPGGRAGRYRLAQIDDYRALRRSHFPWSPPCHLRLEARASDNHLLGTWGFGFWNDPFGLNLGFGGMRLLPEFPDAAWFFFASKPNYLSFRNHLPAQGALAAVFRSPLVPAWMLAPLGVAAPLLVFRWFSRLARRGAAALVQEDSSAFEFDLTKWHTFDLIWKETGAEYMVDDQLVKQTRIAPRGPLGLVIWLDNQYAAWQPDGKLKYGTLETGARWIEIRNLTIA